MDLPTVRALVCEPRNILHEFRLTAPEQIDAAFIALLGEAYEVGLQRHLRPSVE